MRWWGEPRQWWYIGAYADEPDRWRYLDHRGPVKVSESTARSMALDLAERYWGHRVFMWRWSDAAGGWQFFADL